jgi:hypothetical protein
MREYLRHFALSDEPFSKDISDKELWLPPSKQLVVDEVVDITVLQLLGILATANFTLDSLVGGLQDHWGTLASRTMSMSVWSSWLPRSRL